MALVAVGSPMADTASSGTKKRRGRPTGTPVERGKTAKFNKEEAVIRLTPPRQIHPPPTLELGRQDLSQNETLQWPQPRLSGTPQPCPLGIILSSPQRLPRWIHPPRCLANTPRPVWHLPEKRPIGGCQLIPSGPSDPRRRSVANHDQTHLDAAHRQGGNPEPRTETGRFAHPVGCTYG